MTKIKRYKYTNEELKRRFPRIYENIIVNEFRREDNINISGTRAREFLKNNDLISFKEALPDRIKNYSSEIFELLVSS